MAPIPTQNATTPQQEEPRLCPRCPHMPLRMEMAMDFDHNPASPAPPYEYTGSSENMVAIKEEIRGDKKVVTLCFEYPMRPHDPVWVAEKMKWYEEKMKEMAEEEKVKEKAEEETVKEEEEEK